MYVQNSSTWIAAAIWTALCMEMILKYIPVKFLGTRFEVRNCSEPGPQEPYREFFKMSL
jgi:hypothetical protein